jgi:hypothetical protein
LFQHILHKSFISGINIPWFCPPNIFHVEFAPSNNIYFLVPVSHILYHDTKFLCHSAVIGFFCMYNFHSFKISVVTVIHYFWYFRCHGTSPLDKVAHDFLHKT